MVTSAAGPGRGPGRRWSVTAVFWSPSPQVAIAQFSDDPRTEFKLNSYSDKQSLLDAIKSIAYKGGNTKTGETRPSDHTWTGEE